MDLEDSLTSLPFRGWTAQPTIAKMSGQREQATTRRGHLGFHASRTAAAMRRQNSPGAEGCFLLKKESKQAQDREIKCLLNDSHHKGKMMIMTTKTSGSQVDSPVAEGKRKEGGGRKIRDLHKDT